MPVNNGEITRFRGDTYPMTVTLKENGVPVDLTGSTVEMTIGLSDPVKLTAALINPTAGEAQFTFDETNSGTAGRFDYDIQVTNGTIKTTYVKDKIIFKEDVTV